MKLLQKGQRLPLVATGCGTTFSLLLQSRHLHAQADISVFVTDSQQRILSDDYIIFYNQPASPCEGYYCT